MIHVLKNSDEMKTETTFNKNGKKNIAEIFPNIGF